MQKSKQPITLEMMEFRHKYIKGSVTCVLFVVDVSVCIVQVYFILLKLLPSR